MKTELAQDTENALNSSSKAADGWKFTVLDRPQGGVKIIAQKGNLTRFTMPDGTVAEVLQLPLPEGEQDRP